VCQAHTLGSNERVWRTRRHFKLLGGSSLRALFCITVSHGRMSSQVDVSQVAEPRDANGERSDSSEQRSPAVKPSRERARRENEKGAEAGSGSPIPEKDLHAHSRSGKKGSAGTNGESHRGSTTKEHRSRNVRDTSAEIEVEGSFAPRREVHASTDFEDLPNHS